MTSPSTSSAPSSRLFGALLALIIAAITLAILPLGAKARQEAPVRQPSSAEAPGGQPAAPTLSTNTFCNTSAITIPGSGASTPYPATIEVSGLSAYVTGVSVKLNGFAHDFYSDVDILLVGPEGQGVVLMSDIGYKCVSAGDLTVKDGGPLFPQSSCPAPGGTYRPTNREDYQPPTDNFSAPAPPPYYDQDLSTFYGSNPNGTWSLYVVDDFGNLSGSVNGGWCLDITSSDATPVATRTPTVTRTSTPSTPPPTPWPTATGIINCSANVVQATTSCAPGDSYHYRFVVDSNAFCPNTLGTIYLEAAPDVSGPWATVHQFSYQQYLSAGQHNLIEGDIVQTIPAQYLWYRVRIAGNTGFNTVQGQTEPTYICSRSPMCPPSWNARAPYPTPITDHAVTVHGNNLYSFGGRDTNYNNKANAYRYDPSVDNWTALAPMPGARRAASAAAYQSKIYVINGVTSGVINSSYIYDPATDSYTAGPNGLMATFHQAAVVLNGQLYRIGGDTTTGNPTNTVEIYGDHYVASLPQGLALPMAVAYGGYIYVAGATPAGWDVKTYRYDPVSDSWSDVAIADLPVARAGGASGILNGKWILAGGTSEGGNSAIAWDPASNTWESITPMFAGRGNVGGGTIGNAFYVVGGSGHDGATTDTQQYLPTACAGPSPTPTSVPASPTPWPAVTPTGITQCHIVVTQASTYCTLPDIYNYEFHLQPVCSNYNVTLYLEASPDVGGPWTNITEQTITQGSSSTIQGSIQADIPAQYQWYRIRLFGQAIPWSFTGETDPVRICNRPGYCPLSWNARSPYPFTVEDHAIAAQGDSLYSFGGHSGSSNTPLDLAYKYSPTTNTWTSIASLPAGRRDASAASGNGYVYIVNGSNSSGETDTLYRYDPVANSYTSLGQGLLPTTYQAAVYLNGLLYRIGGSTPTGPLPMRATDTVEVYGDHFVAPMPERLVLHMAVALNGYIYVAGGVNGDGAGSLKAYRYDPVSDSWSDSAIADLPLVRQSAVSVALDGKWVIAGGSMDNATTSVISWDPSTNTWSSLTPMGVRRTNAAGAVIDNALYVIGGSAGSGTLADNEEYLPAGCVTATPTMTTTATATATTTATVTDTAVPTTPTTCPINFTDVPGDHTFYSFIRCLACRGIISGYSDGTFKPGNEITRGQIAKMVSNAAGYEDEIPPDQQTFEDVPPDHPFWLWIERLVLHGVMGGYPCGADVEPCNPPGSRPYFRPFNNTTRGQLAKIVSNAAGLGGDPAGQFYTDVPPSHPFYVWIMRLTNLGAMSGYPCGGEAEPCDDANRPYFRPYANVTRGQASKIVANTYYPNCETP